MTINFNSLELWFVMFVAMVFFCAGVHYERYQVKKEKEQERKGP